MRRSCPASRRRHGFLTSGVLLVVTTGAATARADDERVTLRAEVGTEYDSNVHRAEKTGAPSPPVVASPLGRVVLGWSAADRLGANQDVAFSLLGAAKAFWAPEARNENVGIIESSGMWRVAVGGRTRVGLGAATYEAIQAGSPAEHQVEERDLTGDPRDFRSLTPTLRALRAVGKSGALALGVGYRWFVYKPNRDYDFRAPVLSLEYHWGHETADGGADWEIAAGGGIELRGFAGVRFVPANCSQTHCVATPDPAGARHQDQFYSGHFDVTHTGRVLVGAGYALQWNRSNSYAASLLFHVGTLRFTAPLPLGIYLAARAELIYGVYPDPLAQSIGPTAHPNSSIDDEGRSNIRAELSRDISARVQIVARYSLYVNALGESSAAATDPTATPSRGRYLRQTATLSLLYSID